jgi:hypothetical protein
VGEAAAEKKRRAAETVGDAVDSAAESASNAGKAMSEFSDY